MTEKYTIEIIGVNPYVIPTAPVLKSIFKQSGKDKGAIPVKGTINKKPFTQTLVRYKGKWRLYINGVMCKAAKVGVGDTVEIKLGFDAVERITPMPALLEKALKKNKSAQTTFNSLPPSRQKEIKRYINNLKSAEAIKKNVKRAITFLTGKQRFIGRDKP